jgi:hypothetical protein
MKLDCGLTYEEKLKNREQKRQEYVRKVSQWHKYYAWLPVRVGSRDCRWLEKVECRWVENQFSLHGGDWEFRAIT